MKLTPARHRRHRLDPAKFSVLPSTSLGMVMLLLAGKENPELDLAQYDEWKAWWGQSEEKAWGAVLPQRSVIRSLGQANRTLAEVGLDRHMRGRPMNEPPLQDKGVLARMAGMGWARGLDETLDKMAALPTSKAQHLLAEALSHSVKCNQPTSLARLVQWAHEKGWSGQDIGLSPAIVGKAWLLWLGESKEALKFHQSDLDMLLDQSIALSAVRPGNEAEVGFWKALFDEPGSKGCSNAINAWCHRYPDAWTRLHERALEDNSIPHAWLVACRRAFFEGVDTPLWKTALSSSCLPVWLNKTGWSENPQSSPLSSWWQVWIDIQSDREVSQIDAEPLQAPGLDLVSISLRKAGAIEPGSKEDIAMGSCSFAAILSSHEAPLQWFKDNPQWVYNDPQTNSNPIFNCRNLSELEFWTNIGFDLATKNTKGDTAFYAFLSNAAPRNRKTLPAYVVQGYENDTLPVVGSFRGRSSAFVVSQMTSEEAPMAWVQARLRAPEVFCEKETCDLAGNATAPVVLAWIQGLKKDNAWTNAHGLALWTALPFRDLAEDKDMWEEIISLVPLVEDAAEPLWTRIWNLDQDEHPDTLASYLQTLENLGAARQTVDHACWLDPVVMTNFASAITKCDPISSKRLVPGDANEAWWLSQMSFWLRQSEEDPIFGARTKEQMQHWLEAGLPLTDELVSLMDGVSKVSVPQGIRDPWFEAPQVASALSSRHLNSSTPQTNRSLPRRF